jgi:hypothetical protein
MIFASTSTRYRPLDLRPRAACRAFNRNRHSRAARTAAQRWQVG